MSNLVLLIYAAPLAIIWLCLRIMGIGSFRFLKIGFRRKKADQVAPSPTASARKRKRTTGSSGSGSGAVQGGSFPGLNGLPGASKIKPGLTQRPAGVQDRSADIIRKGFANQIAGEKQEADRLRAEQRRVQEENNRAQESRLQEEARLREELERAQDERRREEERLEEERRRAYS